MTTIHPSAAIDPGAVIGEGTEIGPFCHIGPGVEIGDNCIVGAGSVVTKSVPPRCAVGGNPAKILKENIEVGPYGRLLTADDTESRLVEAGLA